MASEGEERLFEALLSLKAAVLRTALDEGHQIPSRPKVCNLLIRSTGTCR